MCCILCRCPLCYDCPSCQHTLSVRATNVTATDTEGHATPRKAYYLACGFCRWTSRDIGLKDQFVGSQITVIVIMIMVIKTVQSNLRTSCITISYGREWTRLLYVLAMQCPLQTSPISQPLACYIHYLQCFDTVGWVACVRSYMHESFEVVKK